LDFFFNLLKKKKKKKKNPGCGSGKVNLRSNPIRADVDSMDERHVAGRRLEAHAKTGNTRVGLPRV
jgi:hypothetical protein